MEQPDSPSKKKKQPPSPRELISYYQSKGLEPEEASLKVIEDLQSVLFRVVSSSNASKKKDKLGGETLRKLDLLHNRLGLVDVKMDSKPGYLESFGIGIAAGAALRGIETTAWPHLVAGVSQIWAAVSNATKPSS